MIDINELRPAVEAAGLNAISMQEVLELLDRLEAAEKDNALKEKLIDRLALELNSTSLKHDTLRAKIGRMEKRLRLILEEPENTMSNSKAMREMIKQARLALEESK